MRKSIVTKLRRHRLLARRVALFLAVIALVLAAELHGRYWSPAGVSAEDRESVALYAEALGTVRENYLYREAVDPEEQAHGAIRGMVNSLGDRWHSRFEPTGEVEKHREAYLSREIGIGVRLEDKGDEVVVLSPLDDSPAEEAGVESEDVVAGVDGESVRGKDIVEVTEELEGPERSMVELVVLRDGEAHEFSLERVELEVPAASWNLIPETDVAHLRLALFSDNSAAELEGAILEAREAGARRFVLDLRDNPGGWGEQAEEVAAQFLPARSVMYIERDAEGNEEETTVPDGNEPSDVPLVVLTNVGSASSAEIVAGALRDNDRAKVVGGKTSGTGTTLEEYPLSDGSAILLATAEWLTPNGDFIRGYGIEPDVQAGLGKGQKPRAPEEVRGLSREEIFAKDAQLERAFEVLQEG
jgi:carboxyl-terminal processing protease